MKTVLIYRTRLLPPSETFILDHYRSLVKFRPVLCGAWRVPGLNLIEVQTFTLSDYQPSRLARFLYLVAPQRSKLAKHIEELKPDLIHAHFALDAVDMVPICRRLGIPLIVTLHGFDVNFSLSAHLRGGALHWRYLMRRSALINYTSLFLPVSTFIRRNAAMQGFPEARMRTHFLGIDLKPFSSEINQGGQKTGIVFVGRLVEKKGVTFLLEALRILKSAGMNPDTTIIGDGPERGALERKVREIGLQNVTFMGTQPRDVVRREMFRSLLVCIPSVEAASGDNEGLPIVALEAQAAGRPVVAFNQGPIPASVLPGQSALLAADRDANSLASCISLLLLDPQKANEMGRRGAAFVRQMFDIEHQSRDLEKIYQDVISAHSKHTTKAAG